MSGKNAVHKYYVQEGKGKQITKKLEIKILI